MMTCWACGGDRWLEGNFGDSGPCPYCKDIPMNEFEKFVNEVLNGIKDIVKPTVKPNTTETPLGANKKKVTVELSEPPSAGGFAGCPSSDCEYDEAMDRWRAECNAKIVAAIPKGYSLKSSEIKEEKIVRHYADLIVEI